jgi:ferredoxin
MDENDGVAAIDPALCDECLACVEVCPNGAVRRTRSSELVPAGDGEIVEGQVIEEEVTPFPGARPLVTTGRPGRLAALAGTTLALVRNWLLPRVADALLGAMERRLHETNQASPADPLFSERGSLTRRKGKGGGGRGHQRRRRRRGG